MDKGRHSFRIRILFVCLIAFSCCRCSAGMVSTISRSAFDGTKYLIKAAHAVLGTSGMVECATAAAAFYAIRAVHERYFTLPEYHDILKPPAGEDPKGFRKHIYTWRPREIDLRMVENLHRESTLDINNNPTLNLNESRLIAALRYDCGAFNVYKSEHLQAVENGTMLESTLKPIVSGEIYWRDLIATLNYEIRKLTEIKEYLRTASRWRIFPGIDRYSVGAERDLANAFFAQHIMTKEAERQMSRAAEDMIKHIMKRPASVRTRILAVLFGAPNYDKTYALYWTAYRRLLWLETLKGIIERTAQAQERFTKIFADIREHAAYEIDRNGQANIIAPVHPVRVPQGQAHQAGH